MQRSASTRGWTSSDRRATCSPSWCAGRGSSSVASDEQLIQQLKKLTVGDLLVQTLYPLSSLGYRKLSEEDRDLDQARLAIESLRALLPVLEGSVDEGIVRDFKQVTSNLQLAYADAAKGQAAD